MKQPRVVQGAGFTLMEMLAVLLIMALLAGSITLNTGFDKQSSALKQEALRLQTFINLASEFAVLNQMELGLKITNGQYQLLGYDEEEWLEVAPSTVLQPHQIAEELTLTLVLDDLSFGEDNLLKGLEWQAMRPEDDDPNAKPDSSRGAQSEREKADEKDKQAKREARNSDEPPPVPDVLLLSSGEITPFRIMLQDKDEQLEPWYISAEFFAPVRLSQQSEEEQP